RSRSSTNNSSRRTSRSTRLGKMLKVACAKQKGKLLPPKQIFHRRRLHMNKRDMTLKDSRDLRVPEMFLIGSANRRRRTPKLRRRSSNQQRNRSTLRGET